MAAKAKRGRATLSLPAAQSGRGLRRRKREGEEGGRERRDRDARSRPPFLLTLCLYSLLVVHFWRRWPRMIVILKTGQVGSGEWEEMGGAPKKRFGCRNTQVEEGSMGVENSGADSTKFRIQFAFAFPLQQQGVFLIALGC